MRKVLIWVVLVAAAVGATVMLRERWALRKATAAFDRGDCATVLSALDDLMPSSQVDEVAVYGWRAWCFNRDERWSEAEAQAAQGLILEPASLSLLYLHALAASGLGHPEAAERDLDRAISRGLDTTEARLLRAVVRVMREEWKP